LTKFYAIERQAEECKNKLRDLCEQSTSSSSQLVLLKTHDSQTRFVVVETHINQQAYEQWQAKYSELLQEVRKFCRKEPSPEFYDKIF